ncbi:hypothetical protein ACFL5K_04650 [Gemmatimonadota bacterium]
MKILKPCLVLFLAVLLMSACGEKATEEKYPVRWVHAMNGRMKEHDIEKMAHYSQLAWTLSGGRAISDGKVPA